ISLITQSPLFASNVDFNQGGTDLGKTQYMDAYTRGDFWGNVQTNTNYHVLLSKPLIAPEQTVNVTSSQGQVISNPWGGYPTGEFDIFAFDNEIQSILAKFPQIKPNMLPIFVIYNVYLTQFGGCCYGGYHSANGIAPGGQ